MYLWLNDNWHGFEDKKHFLTSRSNNKWVISTFKTIGHYGMVRGQIRIHHDVAHLQPLSNVPTKQQLPTLYGFSDIAQTKC